MLKIAQLKQSVGVEGISFTAKVDKVWEQKTLKSEYGEGKTYTQQNIAVSDGSGKEDKLTVTVRDQEEITSAMVGKNVTFESSFSEKMQKKIGVKVVEQEYEDDDGKMKKVIKAIVSRSAKMILGVEEEVEEKTTIATTAKEKVSPLDNLIAGFVGAYQFFTNPTVQEKMQELRALGIPYEDMRAVTISLATENNRRNG